MRIVEKPIELGRRNIIYYEGLSHYDDIVEAVFELPQTLLNIHYNESFMLLKNKGYIKGKNPHETLHRLGTRYMNALYKSSFISFIRFYFIPMYLSVMLPAFFVLVMMSLNVSDPLLSGEDLAAGLFFLGPPTLYYFFGLIKTLRKSDFEKQFY